MNRLKNSETYVCNSEERLETPRSVGETISMRESIVKGDFWSSVFLHISSWRQFSANFRRECRRRSECRSTFIEHAVFRRDKEKQFACEFGPSRKQILLSASRRVFASSSHRDVLGAWNTVTCPDAGRKLYFRSSNENVQKIVLARYRVSDIRTRTGDENGETQRPFRVERGVAGLAKNAAFRFWWTSKLLG